MKRILIVILILVVSVMYTACSDSSDSEQADNEEIQTNEEVENDSSNEEIEKIEVQKLEGEEYTDKATGVITLTVLEGYSASENPYYNTEETIAMVMVIPQSKETEGFTSYLIVQVWRIDDADVDADVYADASINAFAMSGEKVSRIELNGLSGFRVSIDDPNMQWTSEHYVLAGPETKDEDSYYSVYIGGIGLDNSYIDDMHDMISTLDFDFDKL